MTWLGLMLGSIGIVDLLRRNSEKLDFRTVLAWVAAGIVGFVVLFLGDASWPVLFGTLGAIAVVNILWSLMTSRFLGGDKATWLPVLAILALVVGGVSASPWSPDLAGRLEGWYRRLHLHIVTGVPLNRFVLVLGLGLFLTNTGNIIVRVVLTAAGSKVSRSEQQIKGGRVLGPLERLLIFGLGLAGQLAAASIIVAAKGLLRFPELQSYRQELEPADRSGFGAQRIDSLTEYFLIGSLTSWTIALACLVLV